MKSGKAYSAMDYLRIIAALLVISIHTVPLTGVNDAGNFILTRIIARLAVPFFITVSGFFLITRYTANANRVKAFIKKTGIIYIAAIVIYIPLNIYNGYFSGEALIPNIIKDLIFDGTAYHLWYLPASILGAIIAWLAVTRLGFKKALIATFSLYIIGLFGDSYYAVAQSIPTLKELYSYIFTVSDYTRNGIFFTPVFFVLGGFIADKRSRVALKASLIWLGVSLLFLAAEASLVHFYELSRHDSMYFSLLPCMYFLINSLTYWRGKRRAYLSRAALIIYIVHPLVIVAVRMLAKLIGAQALLIENIAVHYFIVGVLSCAIAALLCLLLNKVELHRKAPDSAQRAWLEIDLSSLEHNVNALKRAMPNGCKLMAVVKANAYGHGALPISAYLNKIGVSAFATATIDEAIALRRHAINGEILVLGYTSPERAKELHRYRLTQTLIDYDYALSLNSRGYKIKAHIKIDSGMHRLGFCYDDTYAVIDAFKLKNLNISGIFTHLSASNSIAPADDAFTRLQINRFYELLTSLKQQGLTIPKAHLQSSYGLLNYPKLRLNYVRAGVAMYGVLSSPRDKTRLQLNLRPVLALKAQVVLVREIKCGETAGYGMEFVASRNSKIAVIPLGYADGFSRSFSCNNGKVLINGQYAFVIGRVCMDCLLADVTDIANIAAGDIATLIGTSGGEEISAAEAAEQSGTISNELLSRLGTRLEIRVK